MSNKPYKIKRGHKGLIIFLVIFGILVVLPVGFIFGAFFDSKSKNVSNKEVKYENLVSETFYKGLQSLDSANPELKFTINEEMIDGIMIAACEKINQPNYIPKMYCYIDDNNYTFVADLQASFFKTRAFIHTSLDKEEIESEKTLVFKITGITLGRLPIPLNWVTGLLGNFLNDETLNNAFGESGFHIQSHLAEAKLTYTRSQFRIDVGGYLSKLGDENPFLNVLLSVFDNDEVLTTDYKDGVSVGIALSKLKCPTEGGKYTKPAPIEYTELNSLKTEVVSLLNKNVLEEKEVANLFKYLIRGYDESTASFIVDISQKALATELKKDLIVEKLEDYRGTKVKFTGSEESARFKDYLMEAKDLKDVVTVDPTPPTESINSVTFKLESDKLNKVIACNLGSVIGSTIPVTFKESDSWGFEYIFVDNVYTGFQTLDSEIEPATKNQFVVYIELNVAGVPLTLSIAADNIGLEGNKGNSLGYVKFKPFEALFGKIPIMDDLFNEVLALIPDGNGLFIYDKNAKLFKVQIDQLTESIEGIKPLINTFISGKTLEPKIDKENDIFTLTYSVAI